MGVNTIGFAVSSKFNNLREITDKLNIIVDGPIEECIFEEAISNNSKDNEIYFTQLDSGTLVMVGLDFPFFGEDFSALSETSQKFTKFIYGETSGQYYFEYYENKEFRRSKYISEGIVETTEGKSLPQEFSGLADDELIMNVVYQTCGDDFFSIEPEVKSIKYRYKSGKPTPIRKPQSKPIAAVEDITYSKALNKNRIIFYLVLIHGFLGISNMITSNIFMNKPFSLQISSYILLLIFGIMGYFLLKRKNWMRIIFIFLYFVSIPFSIIALKPNMLFPNMIVQFIVNTMIVVLLFKKDIITLYRQKTIETNSDKISIKDILYLILGVAVFQLGAANIIHQMKILNMGFLTGIISGVLITLGLYIVIRVLRENYHRQQG